MSTFDQLYAIVESILDDNPEWVFHFNAEENEITEIFEQEGCNLTAFNCNTMSTISGWISFVDEEEPIFILDEYNLNYESESGDTFSIRGNVDSSFACEYLSRFCADNYWYEKFMEKYRKISDEGLNVEDYDYTPYTVNPDTGEPISGDIHGIEYQVEYTDDGEEYIRYKYTSESGELSGIICEEGVYLSTARVNDGYGIIYNIEDIESIPYENIDLRRYILSMIVSLHRENYGDLEELPDWIDDKFETDNYDDPFTIGYEDFVIRTTKVSCANRGHQLENIEAIFSVLTPDGITKVSGTAMYCTVCDEYYISEYEYERIRRYGTLCHRVITDVKYVSMNGNYNNWSEQSILHSYGYSANEKEDLSDRERQGIIKFVIDNDIMSATRVLSFLEWLLRNRGSSCINASEKWQRDIQFVKGYLGESRRVGVNRITKDKWEE